MISQVRKFYKKRAKELKVKKSNSSSTRPKKFSSDPIWGLDPKLNDHCLNEVKIDAHTQTKIKTTLLKELKLLNDLYVTLHDYLFLTNSNKHFSLHSVCCIFLPCSFHCNNGRDPQFDDHCLKKVQIDANIQLKDEFREELEF